MSGGGVQLRLGQLPLDPRELASLPLAERAAIYSALDLHPIQRTVAEEAVRRILRGEYLRRGPA